MFCSDLPNLNCLLRRAPRRRVRCHLPLSHCAPSVSVGTDAALGVITAVCDNIQTRKKIGLIIFDEGKAKC